MERGKVYLVGAGPGDSELITVKGIRLLKSCDVVIYDRLASKKLLSYVREDCEQINVGKRVGNHQYRQEQINEIIVKKALEDKCVVRLKGGDSFVFGRGGEEIEELKKYNIAYEVIPGISSSIAALECAGIPVTHRGVSNSFMVVTGHTAVTDNELTDNYDVLAKFDGTLIFLMGIGNIEKITEQLINHGKSKDTKACVVSEGTTNRQRLVRGTLDDIAMIVRQNNINAPAIIAIGDVAGLNMKYEENSELSNVNICVTGSVDFSKRLADELEKKGAAVKVVPTIKIDNMLDGIPKEDVISQISKADYLVFTSTNGVEIFFDYMRKEDIDIRVLLDKKYAVIGKGTAMALKKHGIHADYVPDEYTSKALAEGLCDILKDGYALILRAKNGSKSLVDILKKYNKRFKDFKIYDTVYEENIEECLDDDCDYITFASASSVSAVLGKGNDKMIDYLKRTKVVCIGDITANRLREYGIEDYIIADSFCIEGIVEKICQNERK